MKVTMLIFLLSVTAAGAQEVTVRSYKADNVDLREYATYSWSVQIENQMDDGRCFANDLMLKADVRTAVHAELQDRGYTMVEEDPDLIVNFRIFDKATVLKSARSYGATYWAKEEKFSDDQSENEIKVEVGTLIISLLDKENGKLVWQGFASGLVRKDELIKDEGKIQEAVSLLFEDYGYRISEYTKR
jgi:hypothetical protein